MKIWQRRYIISLIILFTVVVAVCGFIYWFSDKPPYQAIREMNSYETVVSTSTLNETADGDDFATIDQKDLTASVIIETELENRDYILRDSNASNITVHLIEGRATYPYTRSTLENDVGEMELYTLTNTASGDLNADNHDDAVAIVYSHLKVGNGFAPFLVTFLNKNGKFAQASEYDLGGRNGVNSLSIKSGQVIVDMMVHGPEDGACCASVHKIFKYTLDQLIEKDGSIAEEGIYHIKD